MGDTKRIGVHLKYKLLQDVSLEEEDHRGGPLSEAILESVRACLGGLEIDRGANDISGFRVGKNLHLPEELLNKIDEAAEQAGLHRSLWIEAALSAYHKQQEAQ